MTADDELGSRLLLERLVASGKSFFERADLAVTEIIKGYYPEIGQKDMEALRIIFWSKRDCYTAYYDEVVADMVNSYRETFFPSELRARETIKELLSRNLLTRKLRLVTFGLQDRYIITPLHCVFLQSSVEAELLRAVSDIQNESITEYFPTFKNSRE